MKDDRHEKFIGQLLIEKYNTQVRVVDERRRMDKDFSPIFFRSVKTTGVYCRPSCPARLARPEGERVQFHATYADAERAGFRPCKRCKPNQPSLKEQYAAVDSECIADYFECK